MAKVNFSVPDNIKKRFNKVFANCNKSRLIATLMQQAVEEHEKQQRRAHAIKILLKLRTKQKPVTEKIVYSARKEGRS